MGIEVYYTSGSNDDTPLRKGSQWKLGVRPFPGSMETWVAVMSYLERKYLPSLPELYPLEETTPSYHSRLVIGSMISDSRRNNYLQEIFDLQLSEKITKEERLVLLSMMDCSYFWAEEEEASEVFQAWLKVAEKVGPKTIRAFSLLIANCEALICITPHICKITINWNSANPFKEVFGYYDEQFFDCVRSYQVIEDAIEKAEELQKGN